MPFSLKVAESTTFFSFDEKFGRREGQLWFIDFKELCIGNGERDLLITDRKSQMGFDWIIS